MRTFTARTLLALAAVLGPAGAHASHPLITEDTGVLGKGVKQIELHGTRSRDKGDDAAGGVPATRSTDVAAVLSYGATDRADVQLELPYVREVEAGDVTEGRGDVSLALKWRFLERDGLSLVLKPDLHLPTGRDETGLGAGKARWGANFVAGYVLGRFELLGHAGYLRNRNTIGERESVRHLSAAIVFEATDALKLVLDVARDTNPDPSSSQAVREAVVGGIYELRDDVELGAGFKRGLNDAAEDRSVLLGLKVRW